MALQSLYLLSLILHNNSICCDAKSKVAQLLSSKSDVLHKFKVVGENNLLIVISASDGSMVDDFVKELQKNADVEVDYCSPLLSQAAVAEYLKVEKPVGDQVKVTNGPFFWLEFNINYPGKSIEELKTIWSEEAKAALQFKLQGELDLFKVVGERTVHVFIKAPAEMVDEFSFTLPFVRGLGDGVFIVTKAVTRF